MEDNLLVTFWPFDLGATSLVSKLTSQHPTEGTSSDIPSSEGNTPAYGQISWGRILAWKFVTFYYQLWALLRAQKTKLWGNLASIVLSHVGTVLENNFCLAWCPIKLKTMVLLGASFFMAEVLFWWMYCAIAAAPKETAFLIFSCEASLTYRNLKDWQTRSELAIFTFVDTCRPPMNKLL